MSRTTCGNGLIFVAAIWLGLMVTSARGGSLDDPGAPTDPASAMYTAKDIYNRLAFGTNAPKRTGAFTEPTAGPTADTMPTTDEIMAKTPSTNASGAVEGEVLSGKTFWGLTQGAWGTRTGTIATVTLSAANDTVSNGYYAATTLHAVDTDLATNNIRSGVTIFGFAGNTNVVDTSTGNAVAGDVKSGQVAWVQGAVVTGTIATVTLSGTTTNVAAGYYAATNLAQVATNLAAGNIKTTVNIFGVVGTYAGSGGSSTSAPIPKTGQTNFYQVGDDAWWGTNNVGVAWPNPRFTTNGVATDSNCVTDHLTGLMWLKNPDDTTYTWSNAIVYCEGLTGADGRGGYTDWRLPNWRELYSLLNFSLDDSCTWLLAQGFTGLRKDGGIYYWSSTTYAQTTDHAWAVWLGGGDVYPTTKTVVECVWPVRGTNTP